MEEGKKTFLGQGENLVGELFKDLLTGQFSLTWIFHQLENCKVSLTEISSLLKWTFFCTESI